MNKTDLKNRVELKHDGKMTEEWKPSSSTIVVIIVMSSILNKKKTLSDPEHPEDRSTILSPGLVKC